MSLETIYTRAHSPNTIFPFTVTKGEVRKIANNLNNYLGYKSSTSVSSSSWASDNTSVASTASNTNSGGVTGTTLTAVDVGTALVKNTAVLANGETIVRRFYVRVLDPEASGSDYQS